MVKSEEKLNFHLCHCVTPPPAEDKKIVNAGVIK